MNIKSSSVRSEMLFRTNKNRENNNKKKHFILNLCGFRRILQKIVNRILTQYVFFRCIHGHLLHIMHFKVIKIDVEFYEVFPRNKNLIIDFISFVKLIRHNERQLWLFHQ